MQRIIFDRILLLIAAVVMLPAVTATSVDAGHGMMAGHGAEGASFISRSVDADGGQHAPMVRVPTGKRLMLRQSCVEHVAMYVEVSTGASSRRISFAGQGCTSYDPGYAIEGGSTVRCVNRSGVARSCAVMGLMQSGDSKQRRAKFYDVDAELRRSGSDNN